MVRRTVCEETQGTERGRPVFSLKRRSRDWNWSNLTFSVSTTLRLQVFTHRCKISGISYIMRLCSVFQLYERFILKVSVGCNFVTEHFALYFISETTLLRWSVRFRTSCIYNAFKDSANKTDCAVDWDWKMLHNEELYTSNSGGYDGTVSSIIRRRKGNTRISLKPFGSYKLVRSRMRRGEIISGVGK